MRFNFRWSMLAKFLSTPSARRATYFRAVFLRLSTISIHALREEGDAVAPANVLAETYFYPRPPRGGRPGPRCSPRRRPKISIHALREEGDRRAESLNNNYFLFLSTPSARRATCGAGATLLAFLFLSTPSARRATAKTETKSLFSNKLYNILHEFRRALIYNGSKNYPNHAK